MFGHGRSRYRVSLAYRLSPVCSKYKFSVGIKLFGLYPDLTLNLAVSQI